ncbi:PD-(D/E)XK nuclease family protein [Mangrovivirga sp. M17]|uniref:PD-(D/E)XK nuclease family protein n=1 Tax=Mangrovivirga halotolerans TaxID=2993936 RepID=A0ABT3RNG2_9BACT|nr:PD-(D/E)XK nuclease family protein [Mangrovivirga halotolerans]MCX2743342.1 PD-(D/E)XK nuclease family protein [Mangrovivirga halotolerans]
MENTIIPVESIRERDVDLILLEELYADNSFCEWFVAQLSLPTLTSVNGAWRSISDFGLGETDVLFSYNSNDKKIFVLIENKLDTTFQNEQFDRYQKRATKYLEQKDCHEIFTVLIAPELYCENQNEFEDYLTYESIAGRLEFTGSKRNLFKSKLIQIATEKLRRGYQPVNSIPVQKFWLSYYQYLQKNHPSLTMKKPGIVPFNSDWPMLYDDRLKNIVFCHKLAQGNVEATFKGYPLETEIKLKNAIPDWSQFKKHSKSFSMRVFSGKIDRTKNFENQIEHVENGLHNVERMRNWLIKNIHIL